MKQFYYLKFGLLACLTFCFLSSIAQSGRISGKVTDENNQPIPGVSITVKGTSIGGVTDSNGNYSLNETPSGAKILVASYLGYTTQEKSLGGNTQVNFQLLPASTELNELVIIGYGSVSRKELTGSVATVTAKDFQKGTISSPEQLIAGKIAGVSITSNSGAPGSGGTIRIRGGASLNASNDPLIVIDGVPVYNTNIAGSSSPLTLINPNDIESFTVLKDAASTAIYGSRASNGVILITTKKGTAGKPVVNFSTLGSVSNLIKKADVLSADEFREYVNESSREDFKPMLGDANTDWQDVIYESALATDNNLSISGAYKNIPFRVSGGYLNQDGILKTNNFERISAGISLSPSFLDNHLKLDVNLKGANSKSRFANGAAISSAVYFDPTQQIYEPNQYGGYFEWSSVDNGVETINKLSPRNPLALLELYQNRSNVNRGYGNIQLDYKMHFLPELRANLNAGFDRAKGEGTVKVPAYAGQNFLDSGQNNQYANEVNNKVGEFYLNYNKTITAIKSNFNLTAGYGYYDNISTDFNFPFVRANGNIVPGSDPAFPFGQQQNTMISYYSRLIYTYNDRYILAGSLRRDGSSRFSEDNRWGTFGSVAFTWRLNQENFLNNIDNLSDLKLRLSYGVTGQQDGIANYSYLPVYNISNNSSLVQFGNEFYEMGSPSAYDAGLKWEQTVTYNAGLDYGFFNDRITGSVDVYLKKTEDLLNVISVSAGSNFNNRILTNVGNMENRGIEFQINATPIKGSQLTWDVSFNATYNDSKITKLTVVNDPSFVGTPLNGTQIHSVGYQPYSFYVYHQQYTEDGQPIEGAYADINGDGTINSDDLYRYKSAQPKYILGFTNQLTLKKWTLSTVLRANIGNYMHNNVAGGAISSNVFNSLGFLQNSLSELTRSGFANDQRTSDYFVKNASFLKMDNLSLAYNVGRVFNAASVSVNANIQNVFTITKYDGIDPEIFGGIDNALYPRPRIFGIGANIQF